jgi:hypothetical protein
MTNEEIIKESLRVLPVGNIKTHTPDSIPERVEYYVKMAADGQEIADEAANHLEDLLNEFDNRKISNSTTYRARAFLATIK